jgi:hypothetical protein
MENVDFISFFPVRKENKPVRVGAGGCRRYGWTWKRSFRWWGDRDMGGGDDDGEWVPVVDGF